MSKGTINKVILIGNLGADPEVRQSPSGSVVATLSLATTDAVKDQQGGWQDRTEWHRVTVFGRTAEVARDYLRKGSKVFIEGRLQTRKWQDKNTGQDRYSTEIIANEMQMLERAAGGGGGGGGGDGGYSPAVRTETGRYNAPPPSAAPQQEPGYGPGPGYGGGSDDFDDDIPF